jgi:hypothetical protein
MSGRKAVHEEYQKAADEVLRLKTINERHERRFREAEAEWVERFELLEAEILRLRAALEGVIEKREVERLRKDALHFKCRGIITERDEEIERLRASLEELVQIGPSSTMGDFKRAKARAVEALGHHKE